MKKATLKQAILLLLFVLTLLFANVASNFSQPGNVDAMALQEEETPQPSRRPLISIEGYDTGGTVLYGGSKFDLTLYVHNNGKEFANNIVISFEGG